MDPREIRWAFVDWIHLTQGKVQWGSCEHGNEPSGSIKGETFLD